MVKEKDRNATTTKWYNRARAPYHNGSVKRIQEHATRHGHHIFTDHTNLIYDVKYENDRIMRQRLYIEEFGPKIKYIEGPDNVAADTISRNPFEEGKTHPLLKSKDINDITKDVCAAEKFIVRVRAVRFQTKQ